MHENSVKLVTFFRDAAFTPVLRLNKIDPNQRRRDNARSDDANCSRGAHRFTTQMLTASIGAGFRESRIYYSCIRRGIAHPVVARWCLPHGS